MGTGAIVPVTGGSARLSQQHPEPKGFEFFPIQFLRLHREKLFICTCEIKDGRVSSWGHISPPSAPAQTASKMQMSSLDPRWVQARTGREAGSAFWGIHKARNPAAQLENSLGCGSSSTQTIPFPPKTLSPDECDLSRCQILPLHAGFALAAPA